MCRSNGYRPKAAVREAVAKQRALLAQCPESQWVRAGMYMDNITTLLGVAHGPSRARVQPRACRYCRFYGHTRQWCKKKAADEKMWAEFEVERLLAEHATYLQTAAASEVDATAEEVYEPVKSPQARAFDRMRMPFTVDTNLGPMVGVPGGRHDGAWTFNADRCVVSNS